MIEILWDVYLQQLPLAAPAHCIIDVHDDRNSTVFLQLQPVVEFQNKTIAKEWEAQLFRYRGKHPALFSDLATSPSVSTSHHRQLNTHPVTTTTGRDT